MPKIVLLLECLLCCNKYDASAVEKGLYYLQTQICKSCYVAGQKQDAQVWCFGKVSKRDSPGYSEGNIACQSLCPDRRICIQFINRSKENK